MELFQVKGLVLTPDGGEEGFEVYEFGIPIGWIDGLRFQSSSIGFRIPPFRANITKPKRSLNFVWVLWYLRKRRDSNITCSVHPVSKSFLTALPRKVKINFYLLTRLSVALFSKELAGFSNPSASDI